MAGFIIKSGILIIGEELLNGAHPDVNGPLVNQFLLRQGCRTKMMLTCSDEVDDIVDSLSRFPDDIKLIITSGGLGRTRDDCSLEAISKWSGQDLSADNQDLTLIDNPVGRAPATVLYHQDRMLVTLPGVPKEFSAFLDTTLADLLREHLAIQHSYLYRGLNVVGLRESEIDKALGEHGDPLGNPKIGLSVKDRFVKIHLLASSDNDIQAKSLLDAKEQKIRDILGQQVFSLGDESMEELLVTLLKEKSLTLSCAESCTGGLLSHLISNVPGASHVFKQSWVTYSAESKIKELSIPAEVIEEHGVVSAQVAMAMAEAARKLSKADIAVGVTGNAGPSCNDKFSKFGQVFIAISTKQFCEHEECHFRGRRVDIKLRAAMTCLNMLRLKLIKHS